LARLGKLGKLGELILMADGVQYIGKFLVLLGLIVAALGGLLLISGKIPWIGKLPGDILIQRKNFTFYFPLATSILLSLILTLIFWLTGKK
jgi:Protein of unknown function (DUF2905)